MSLALLLLLWLAVVANAGPASLWAPPRPADLLLQDLALGPLRGRNVFLIHDGTSGDEVDLDRALRGFMSSSKATVASQEGFLESRIPTDFVRGEESILVLLFSGDPEDFLDTVARTDAWNPSYLVLLTTNASLDTAGQIGHPLVQRSRRLVMFEPGRRGFQAFTSQPLRPGGLRSPLGPWNRSSFRSLEDLFPDRHSSFHGTALHLGSWCNDYPFIYERGDDCVGSNLDILSLIGERLNFTYVVQWITADEDWGSLVDGRWTGMLGDLAYNGKHLVINLFVVSHDRWRAFDATEPYYAEGFGFLARQPLPVPRWRSLTYPFSASFWIFELVCTVAVSCVFALLVASLGLEGDEDRLSLSLKVSAGVLRQSVPWADDVLRRAWQRLWLASWWLACIIVTTAYTCNLIAILTVPVYSTRVETVYQLARSDLRIAMMDYGDFLPEALKQSTDPDFLTIGHKLDLFPNDNDFTEDIYAVMNRTHAITDTYSYLWNVQLQYGVAESTYLMREQVYSSSVAWFLPKNTPYTSKISTYLTRLREAGVVDKLYRDHFLQVSRTVASAEQEAKMNALSVVHLQGAFLLLVLGLGASLLTLVVEVVVSLLQSSSVGGMQPR